MAKNLNFSIGGKNYEAAPVKIERKKLYGWVEIKALDDEGSECTAVSIDEGGELVIPKGGTGMGILDTKGCWVERDSLKSVFAETGNPAPLVPSSYDAPVILDKPVSAEEFLDYEITAFYQLDGAPPDFINALNGKIYSFIYNLRAGYEGSPAFVLTQEGTAYMFTGYKSDFQFLSLEQAGAVEDETEGEIEDESEEIDFSFM
jgi:hypothetical protein